MSLSQENINKLCMSGIYSCEPVLDWLPSYKRDEPYWSNNWVFSVVVRNDTYYMSDTYGGTCFELTDDNFHIFKYLFDKSEVINVSKEDFYDYNEEDRWFVPLNSAGWRFCHNWLVRKGAKKNKEYQLDRLRSKLESARWQVTMLEKEIKEIEEST